MRKTLFLAVLLTLTGCAANTNKPDSGNEKDNLEYSARQEGTTAEQSGADESVTNNLNIGRPLLMYWGDGMFGRISSSRITDENGNIAIPMSQKDKGLIKDIKTGEIRYIYSTEYNRSANSSVTGDYSYEPVTVIYDTKGEKVRELNCMPIEFCFGDYALALNRYRTNGQFLNLQTGEVVFENVTYVENGGSCLIFQSALDNEEDSVRNIFITDFDFNITYDAGKKYNYIYNPCVYSAKGEPVEYLLASSVNYESSSMDVINSKGERLLPTAYDGAYFSYNNDYMLAVRKNGTDVYSTRELKKIAEYNKEVVYINDSCYLTRDEDNSCTLYNRENNEPIAHGSNITADKDLFFIYNYSDDNIKTFISVADSKGSIIIEDNGRDRGHHSYIGTKGLISFTGGESGEFYTKTGQCLSIEKDYSFLYNAVYNEPEDEPYSSYAIGEYEEKGYNYYDLLDEKGSLLISHIRSYNADGRYFFYTRGFKRYIMDLTTMENIYEESQFNTLAGED